MGSIPVSLLACSFRIDQSHPLQPLLTLIVTNCCLRVQLIGFIDLSLSISLFSGFIDWPIGDIFGEVLLPSKLGLISRTCIRHVGPFSFA